MRNARNVFAWGLVLLSSSNLNAGSSLTPVPKANLCVTEGTIEELPGQRLAVNVPKMRAYVNAYTLPVAEARFTYLGSTGNEAALASGEMRPVWSQIARPGRPGEHTSAQCTNHGYQNIKPRRSFPVPALNSGETHTLRAEMNGADMQVFADNSLVWEGSVIPDALSFDGPVGIRSDNARLQIDFRTGRQIQEQGPGCRGPESE